MTALNQPIPPVLDRVVLREAVDAMLDAQPRTVTLSDGRVIRGWIWEVYRSIQTPSVRFRMSDERGYVYHFNTLDVGQMKL